MILSEEVHRRDANIENAQDQAFVMENKSRGGSRGPNDRKFNGKSQSRDRSSSRKLENASIVGKMAT